MEYLFVFIIFARNFPEFFLRPFQHHIIIFMGSQDTKTKVIPSDEQSQTVKVSESDTQSIPWSRLVYSYASKKERCLLFTGLFCNYVWL